VRYLTENMRSGPVAPSSNAKCDFWPKGDTARSRQAGITHAIAVNCGKREIDCNAGMPR